MKVAEKQNTGKIELFIKKLMCSFYETTFLNKSILKKVIIM